MVTAMLMQHVHQGECVMGFYAVTLHCEPLGGKKGNGDEYEHSIADTACASHVEANGASNTVAAFLMPLALAVDTFYVNLPLLSFKHTERVTSV